eukprot:TRINITY_DN7082_c0_g1_i2.p1 TRINITY_DN7082_c0_g1~~TRINITY_DN7082_c0_g1_i2.p1  ORF type:complete len:324 (+),score=58.84 TRINITY_DN7082_c0_g1_i2:246-1217(+)
MFVLILNLALIAIMSSPLGFIYGGLFESLDLIFLVIYFVECLIKFTATNIKFYWSDPFNRLDLLILATSFLQIINIGGYSVGRLSALRTIRAFRACRAFRFIGMVRDLQVISLAILRTFRTLIYVLSLLVIVLFVGAAMAFNIFGGEYFGSLLRGMLTSFCFVTADGWTNIQGDLDDAFGETSRIYTLIVIFLGHFIFENLLAGLMIQYLTDAEKHEQRIRKKKKQDAINKKKAFILEQQKSDLASFMEKQMQIMKDQPQFSFDDILSKLGGKIRHNNVIPSSDLSCSLTWMGVYLTSLQQHEHNMYRMQQLHFETAKMWKMS